GGDQVFAIAAVVRKAGDLAPHAGEELAAAAGIAPTAVAAVPADAHLLARLPARDAGAHLVNDSRHLVAGDTRGLDAPGEALLDERVPVADAAGPHPDAHRARAGLRDGPFHDVERAFRARDLRNTHGGHVSSSLALVCGRERCVRPGSAVRATPSSYAARP